MDRGAKALAPRTFTDLDNLLLLCPVCHKTIDDNPADFTAETLKAYKRSHEDRVRHVTTFGPDLKTSVVQLKARIAGRAIDIPITEVYDAVAPRWPTNRRGHLINLTDFDCETEAGTAAAVQCINNELHHLYAPGMDVAATRNISLFALGPIHVLAHLGSKLSDKVATELFQRHRDTAESPWKWRTSETLVKYSDHVIRESPNRKKVALVLSLSGPIPVDALPPHLSDYTVYEVTLDGHEPRRNFLRAAKTSNDSVNGTVASSASWSRSTGSSRRLTSFRQCPHRSPWCSATTCYPRSIPRFACSTTTSQGASSRSWWSMPPLDTPDHQTRMSSDSERCPQDDSP